MFEGDQGPRRGLHLHPLQHPRDQRHQRDHAGDDHSAVIKHTETGRAESKVYFTVDSVCTFAIP